MALDIGPKSVQMYIDILKEAKTVIWNGPIGVFEFEKFATGTRRIAEELAKLDATTIIGGGEDCLRLLE